MIPRETFVGTSIFGVVVRDRIVIAADSLTTVFETNEKRTATKFIHLENQPVKWDEGSSASVFWVNAGDLPKHVENLKLQILQESLSESREEVKFIELVLNKTVAVLATEFSQIQKHRPDSFNRLIEKEHNFITILLGVLIGRTATVYEIGLGLKAQTSEDGTTTKHEVVKNHYEVHMAILKDQHTFVGAGYIGDADNYTRNNNYNDKGAFEVIAEAMKRQLAATPHVSGYPIEFLDVLPTGEIKTYSIQKEEANIAPPPPKVDFAKS